MRCPCCNHDNLPGVDWCDFCTQDMTEQDRPMPYDRVEKALMTESVEALRPRPAVTLSPDTALGDAVRYMADHDIGAILVVDAGEALVGILTERDVLLRAIDPDLLHRPIGDLMTRRPETIRETDSLAFALHKMDCGGYRHLPVLRDRQLVGMISVRDLLGHITRLCKGLNDVG